MTNSEQAIREFAEAEHPDMPGISERAIYNQIMATNRTNLIARLTALISEHYYPKEFVQWITRPEKVAVLWSKAVDRGLDELFNYWKENER